MSATAAGRPRRRAHYRLRRTLIESGSVLLGAAIVVWSLIPVLNMFRIALDRAGHNEFSTSLWPDQPTLHVFADLWTAGADDVEDIWTQFGNSLYVGVMAAALTLLFGSLASFSIGRMRLTRQRTITGAALLTYAIPASILVIPLTEIIQLYAIPDDRWSVIAAEVTFATPYAILVLLYYAKLVPSELDDAARIDGASVLQVYRRIYLPLMAPALAAVGTYALLYAWNDYFYQDMLLMSEKHSTVAVALEQFFDDDDSPWNYMMAIAIIYSLPPIATFYALRRFMATGLTAGGMKG
jgi:multiple sugar transport system permease protein